MSAAKTISADVCVIGGGPAGSTVARQLAVLGHDVCLLEREAFPRTHIGASLPGSILPLLDFVGVRDRVENAGFPRLQRTTVWWSEARPAVRILPGPPGFHVDRGEFDRLLLQNAEACGVKVVHLAHAMPPRRCSEQVWKISFGQDGEIGEVTSRFVIDASGGRTLLPGRRPRASTPLLAIYAHWRTAADATLDGLVEAGQREWFWCAPLGNGRTVAAVFLDPKRLSGLPRGGIEGAYRTLIGEFRLFNEARSAHIGGPVKACDASLRYAEQPVGSDFIRVGDANLSLDPLSSQGVQTAIASAIQAAVVVNTLRRYSINSEAAITFYRNRQQERVRQHAAKAADFYRERAAVSDQPFWQHRASSLAAAQSLPLEGTELDCTCQLRVSKMATVEQTPVIRGDSIVPSFALCHETLARPVAFLEGVEIVPLLRQIEAGQTPPAIVQAWSDRLPIELGWKIMQWLWSRKIVVPSSDC
jgi:flavin-dependent dehydrogenase